MMTWPEATQNGDHRLFTDIYSEQEIAEQPQCRWSARCGLPDGHESIDGLPWSCVSASDLAVYPLDDY